MNFSEDQNTINETIKNMQIFSIEIDLGSKCNVNCSFCSLTNIKSVNQEYNTRLSFLEISDLITQAISLGAQKIILFDNSSDQHINKDKIIEFVNKKNIRVEYVSDKIKNRLSLDSLSEDSTNIDCLKHKYSCFVTLYGIVYPCVGMPLQIGNIRKDSLKSILRDSEVIDNLRNHVSMIKGPCRKCEKISHCYGCRARVYSLTGDYLGSDPLCPENQDKLNLITYLPMPVENLIPQKSGMRVVSNLLEIGERYAKVESTFSDKSQFIKKDGSLEEITYMEIMAQSAAVMNGFEKFDTGAPDPGGFLIGGRKINIYAKTYAGERLIIDIFKTTKFGNFGILTAKIKRGDDLIADGEIKIYKNDGVQNEV